MYLRFEKNRVGSEAAPPYENQWKCVKGGREHSGGRIEVDCEAIANLRVPPLDSVFGMTRQRGVDKILAEKGLFLYIAAICE